MAFELLIEPNLPLRYDPATNTAYIAEAGGDQAISQTANPGFGKKKTADESVTSSTVLQNDNHLVVPVKAYRRYMFYVWGSFYSDPAADFKYAFDVPSGCDGSYITYRLNETNVNPLPASDTISSGGSEDEFWLRGYLYTGSTAGNITLQWAQNTSNVVATTLFTGSLMVLYEL